LARSNRPCPIDIQRIETYATHTARILKKDYQHEIWGCVGQFWNRGSTPESQAAVSCAKSLFLYLFLTQQ
jgi:hypothetical protein